MKTLIKSINKMKKQDGFTLLEVVVAFSILMIIAMPLLSLFLNSTSNVVTSDNISTATFVAQQVMEELVPLSYDDLLNKEKSSVVKTSPSGNTLSMGYTLKLEPIGVNEYDFNYAAGELTYFHIFINGSKITAIGPDFSSGTVSDSGAGVQISITSSTYTVTANSKTVVSGTIENKPVVVIANLENSTISGTYNIRVTSSSGKNNYLVSLAGGSATAITSTGFTASKSYGAGASFAKSVVKATVQVFGPDNMTVLTEYTDTLSPVNPA